MPPPALIPPERWSLDTVLFGKDVIREFNQQRFEMEHLDAITFMDTEAGEIVGYKDVSGDEFWVRGHVPGRPLLPGVIMLEALAQLTSFYAAKAHPDMGFIGLGSMTDAKFRRTVTPGERLVLLGRPVVIKPRRAVFDTQGWSDGQMVLQARITGLRI